MPRTRQQPRASHSGMWHTSAFGALATRFQMVTGTYTGDGNATQAIAGLGFQPIFVKIYPQSLVEVDWWAVSKFDVDGVSAHFHDALNGEFRYEADHIVSLDADGFTVGDGTGSAFGPTCNIVATTYTYIAFGAGAGSIEMAFGIYTGDGNATQAVAGAGLRPKWVFIYRREAISNTCQAEKTDQDGLRASIENKGDGHTYRLDNIISLDADGFTVGDGTAWLNRFNELGALYAYYAFG